MFCGYYHGKGRERYLAHTAYASQSDSTPSPMHQAAYSGTLFIPFAKPKFLADTLIENPTLYFFRNTSRLWDLTDSQDLTSIGTILFPSWILNLP